VGYESSDAIKVRISTFLLTASKSVRITTKIDNEDKMMKYSSKLQKSVSGMSLRTPPVESRY